MPPAAGLRWWYRYYFATERGRAGYDKYRRDFSKLIWQTASPKWSFDDATFDRSAAPIASANSKLRGAEEGEGRASGRAATVNRSEKPAACRTPRSVDCGAPASSESCGTSSKAACAPVASSIRVVRNRARCCSGLQSTAARATCACALSIPGSMAPLFLRIAGATLVHAAPFIASRQGLCGGAIS